MLIETTKDAPPGRPSGSRRKRRMMQSLTAVGQDTRAPVPTREIPAPDVPVHPILSYEAFSRGSTCDVPSVLDAGSATYVTAGRVAIGLALKLMGVAAGDKVLIPAYHCASMVDPLAWVSATPEFYRIRGDLSVDFDDLERKVNSQTKVVMATHYFGFPQKISRLREFCDAHKLLLLEDCAHSFFGEVSGRPPGSFGDFSISSLTKFFPVMEGGCLVSKNPLVAELPLQSQNLLTNVREAFSTIEEAIYHKRLGAFKPLAHGLDLARALRKMSTSKTPDISPARIRSGASGHLDARWLDVGISYTSLWISQKVSTDRIVRRRRQIFTRLLEGFSARSGFRPLFGTLPDGVVPYMFPLWVDNLPSVFAELEDRAIPMQRFGQFLWQGVDEAVCQESNALSQHLIQLPCHQELRDNEVDWIVDTVTRVISTRP